MREASCAGRLRRPTLFHRGIFWLCVAAQLFGGDAKGATYVWFDAAGNWNDGANWTGGVPVSDPATILQFGSGSADYTSTYDIGSTTFTLNQLLLAADAGRGNTLSALTLTNTLQLTGDTPLLQMLGAGTFTVRTNVNMATGGVIDVANAAGTLVLGNGVASGSTFNGLAAGAVITKTGAGTLVMENTGNNLARLNIAAGTVTTNFDGGFFGGSTVVDVAAGATLDFGGFGEALGAVSGAGTVLGGFSLSPSAVRTISRVRFKTAQAWERRFPKTAPAFGILPAQTPRPATSPSPPVP